MPFRDRRRHFYNSAAYLATRPHLQSETSRMDFVFSFYPMERFLYEQGILEQRPVILSFDSEDRIPETPDTQRE